MPRNFPSRILALLALFIACYLGAHFFIRWKNTKRDDVTRVLRAVECDPIELRSFRVERGDSPGQLEFRRLDGDEPGVPGAVMLSRWRWSLSSAGLSGEADPGLVRRIASGLCELYDPIQVRAEDFRASAAEGGLARRVHAELLSGTGTRAVELEFGAQLPENQMFLKLREAGGKERAYRVPQQLLRSLSRPLEEYRNRRVMFMEADNVQQLRLRARGKESFSLTREGAGWMLSAPGLEPGRASEEADRFLNRLATLQAIDFGTAEYPPRACSMAPAKIIVELSGLSGKHEELRFDYGNSGAISSCSSARSTRFFVHRDMLRYLDVPPAGMKARR